MRDARSCFKPLIRFLGIPVLLVLVGWAAPSEPVHASDVQSWTVTETSGGTQVRAADGAWRAIARGAALAAGSQLKTGADGRAVLTGGTGTITVSPGSNLEIPLAPEGGMAASVLQTLGTLLFRIEKRPEDHFQVDTPYLATVVKGTTFTVTVNPEGSAVHVTEGAVQVRAFDTGQTAMVRPGQTATVAAVRGSGLTVIGGRQSLLRDRSTGDEQAAPETNAKEKAGRKRSGKSETGNHVADRKTKGKPKSKSKHRAVMLAKASAETPAGAEIAVGKPDASKLKKAGARNVKGEKVTPKIKAAKAKVAAKPLLISRAVGEIRIDIPGITKGLARGIGRAAPAAGIVEGGAAPAPAIDGQPDRGVSSGVPAGTPPVKAGNADSPTTKKATVEKTRRDKVRAAMAPLMATQPVSAPRVAIPVVSAPAVSAPVVSAPVVSAPVVSAPVVLAPRPTAGALEAPKITVSTSITDVYRK